MCTLGEFGLECHIRFANSLMKRERQGNFDLEKFTCFKEK